ncbi:MAG: glycosyltransferase family 4 protein [Kiritimatiellae bacterium]|nr:glycosyltransferase family 4 protein [Kiritimatiellia bacterium]
MRILVLAPQPFFQERGTPIAVDLLVKTLADGGHSLEILTYHEGENPNYDDRIRIHRIIRPPFVNRVPPGFSAAKVLCDIAMWRKASHLTRIRSYEIVHAVEESAFIALHLRRRFGVPYVYDMDSSLPQQMLEKFVWLRPLRRPMEAMERNAIRNAAAIVAVCAALADIAKRHGAQRVTILHDVPLIDIPSRERVAAVRREFTCEGPLLLYVGNLEPYQGIELLLDSFARIHLHAPASILGIVGGTPDQIRKLESRAKRLGIGHAVRFAGPRPLRDLGLLCAAADVLVSPRLTGINTPMKVYSYMLSGKPIAATNIPSHTQALSPETAFLADPDPDSYASAMLRALEEPALAAKLGNAARAEARDKYGLATYRRTLLELYRELDIMTKNHGTDRESRGRKNKGV